MKTANLFTHVFPPPRRRVTVKSALPLALFIASFIAVWLFFEHGGVIRFSSPWMLLLLAAAPWVWWMHNAGLSGLSGIRAALALAARLSIIGIFIMLLAQPRAVRKSYSLSVIYAVDLSDSIGEKASDNALAYIMKTVAEKPQKDEAGLVVFGRDASVELPPRISFPFEVVNSRIARDGTDIEKALSLAAAMLSEEKQGRIVLVSDGVETEGTVSGVLDEIKARGIAIDVLSVQYEYEDEVWVERLDLPRFVKAGQTYEVSIILSSLCEGTGNLALLENGETIYEGEVEFGPGKNRYTLPLYLRGPGYYEYAATIRPPRGKDGWQENNIAINYLYLMGEGKVLVVTSPEGDTRDWESFVEALRETGHLVEMLPAYQFPQNALFLMPYDCIIFPNVPADSFDAVQLSALRDAVCNQGVGFLMIGGKNSFGPGGYHRTPAEEALPVTMDISQKKVLPKGALVIILHTCEFPEGNTWAKRIAKEAVRVLGAKDEVGALGYDWSGGEKWLFPLTPAGQYETLSTLINQAQIGDMPSFSTTMKMGVDALKASDAAMKHIIIISDGDPSPPTPELLADFVNSKVSVSTVAINPHGQQDLLIMQSIASATGGRYYFPQNPAQLPSIFIKEAKTLKRSMIQEKVFTPRAQFPSPVMKGIETVPQLRGYVLTTPKPRSEVILRSPETEEVEPVLATWRYGVGRSAAFTSDLSPNWGSEWVNWDKYRAFVNQLMTDISRVRGRSDLHIRSFAAGDSGTIVVEDYGEQGGFLDVEAQVSGPRQRSEAVALKQTGPRRYEGKFPLWGKGQYQVAAVGAGDGRSERAFSGFAVPYSPEYLRFRSNPILLRQIAERTAGRVLTGQETGKEIFSKDREPKESSRPVTDLFLILLACLVPLDVALRRIQLDMYVIRQWLGFGGKKISDATLGALLRRKREIVFVPGEKAEAKPMPPVPPTRKEERPVPEKPKPGEADKKEQPKFKDASTLERLLDKKKKWKKKE